MHICVYYICVCVCVCVSCRVPWSTATSASVSASVFAHAHVVAVAVAVGCYWLLLLLLFTRMNGMRTYNANGNGNANACDHRHAMASVDRQAAFKSRFRATIDSFDLSAFAFAFRFRVFFCVFSSVFSLRFLFCVCFCICAAAELRSTVIRPLRHVRVLCIHTTTCLSGRMEALDRRQATQSARGDRQLVCDHYMGQHAPQRVRRKNEKRTRPCVGLE